MMNSSKKKGFLDIFLNILRSLKDLFFCVFRPFQTFSDFRSSIDQPSRAHFELHFILNPVFCPHSLAPPLDRGADLHRVSSVRNRAKAKQTQ